MSIRLIDTDAASGACRYLSRYLVDGNRVEMVFVVIVDSLENRVGSIEDNKGISGDVRLFMELALGSAQEVSE